MGYRPVGCALYLTGYMRSDVPGMHWPKHVDYRVIGRHLLFWLAYLLYIVLDEGWERRDVWYFRLPAHLLTDVPIAILIVYANLYLLMPAFYLSRRYVPYIIGFVGLLLLGGLAGRFFAWSIWLPLERISEPARHRPEPTEFWIIARIVKNAADIFPVVAATMVIKLMRNAYQQEKQLRAIEKEKFTAEMDLLKAQINPHFFFNTLNSVYALTLAGSKKSADVVLRLADLMRYVLYEASASKVSLRDEITHLENYIGIEQMRFADRLDLSFQCSGDIDGKEIVPLLVLPFIENAFKHGIEDASGWITIDLKVTGNRLFLKVENSFDPTAALKPKGLGLSNVKRRLALTYPQSYALDLKPDNGVYTVDLKLDL